MASALTPLLERVRAALATGERLDLLPSVQWEDSPSSVLMRAWGPEHDLPATDLRAVLLEHTRDGGPTVDPRGLRLRGARILGRLNLDYARIHYPLRLLDCLFTEGLSVRDARLQGLSLHGSSASNCSVDTVDLDGALIDGELVLSGTTIRTSGPGAAAVSLEHCRCSGALACNGAVLRSESGRALMAQRASIAGHVFLSEGFSARAAANSGGVDLLAARIDGNLSLSAATLSNTQGPALVAHQAVIHGDLLLEDGFFAQGAGSWPALWLPGVEIHGELRASGHGCATKPEAASTPKARSSAATRASTPGSPPPSGRRAESAQLRSTSPHPASAESCCA